MLTWILAVAAQSLALGYAAGRIRLLERLTNWALRTSDADLRGEDVVNGFAAEVAIALALVVAGVVHPLRTYRAFWRWRQPEELESAPDLDPDWSAR